MAQVDQHHCQVKRDCKQHSKKAGLLTLSSSTDVSVSSSAQALVSMVTSIPVKDAATPLQAINTFMPSYRFRQERVIADTSYLLQCMHFVGRLRTDLTKGVLIIKHTGFNICFHPLPTSSTSPCCKSFLGEFWKGIAGTLKARSFHVISLWPMESDVG